MASDDPRSPRSARSGRTGRPDVDALLDVADAEQARLEEVLTVNAAEGVVVDVRQQELLAAQKAAHRRLAAAKGLLTKAQRDGDAERIAAARRRVEAGYREFERISHEGIHEQQQLLGTRLDELGQVLDQTTRAWEASAAATDALTGPARAARERAADRRRGPEPDAGPGQHRSGRRA